MSTIDGIRLEVTLIWEDFVRNEIEDKTITKSGTRNYAFTLKFTDLGKLLHIFMLIRSNNFLDNTIFEDL